MERHINLHQASPANPLNTIEVTGTSISNQHSVLSASDSNRSRGSLVHKPYTLTSANSAFARYDSQGREKPSAQRPTGHSRPGMQGVICVGHGCGSLNPAYLTTDREQDPLNQNGPIVLGTSENPTLSPNRQYKAIRAQDLSANRYNCNSQAFNSGKVIRSKTPLSHFKEQQHRSKSKRPTSAAPRMLTPDVVTNDIHPVPAEAPPKPPPSPVDVRQVSSTLEVFEENHSTKLANYFCQLYKHDQLTDILVHVGSYSFSAHKTMLCCFSPFLATAILRSPETKELYLSDSITPTGFKKILDYMYTKELSIEVENLAEILQAATVLNMPILNHQCKDILECAKIPALLDILETSHKQGVQGVLQSMVVQRICSNFSGIYKFTEFLELCQVCLCGILTRDDIVVESEIEVSKAALAWIKYNTADRLALLETVFACVRLGNMSSLELVRLGQDAPMLMENESVRDGLLKAHWVTNSSELKLDCGLDVSSCKPRIYTKHAKKTAVVDKSEPLPVSNKPSVQSHAKGHDKNGHGHKHETAKISMHATHVNNNNSLVHDACFYYSEATSIERQCMSDPTLDLRFSSIWLSETDGQSYVCLKTADAVRSKQSMQMLDQPVAVDTACGSMESLGEPMKALSMSDTCPPHDLPGKSTQSGRALSRNELKHFDPLAKNDENRLLFYAAVNTDLSNGVIIRAIDTASSKTIAYRELPENLIGFQLVYSKPYVYIIGGSFISNPATIQPVNTVWRLHTTSKTWSQLPSMHHARYLSCAAVVNEKVYALGGVDARLGCVQSVEALEVGEQCQPVCEVKQWRVVLERQEARRQWRQLSPMPGPRFGAAACVNGSAIYVAGGAMRFHGMTDDSLRSSVLAYETKTDTWSRIAYLSRPRFQPSIATLDGDVHIAGGLTSVDRCRFARRVEVLARGVASWRKLGAVRCRRAGGHAYVNGHQLWIAGGCVYGEQNDDGANVETIHVL